MDEEREVCAVPPRCVLRATMGRTRAVMGCAAAGRQIVGCGSLKPVRWRDDERGLRVRRGRVGDASLGPVLIRVGRRSIQLLTDALGRTRQGQTRPLLFSSSGFALICYASL